MELYLKCEYPMFLSFNQIKFLLLLQICMLQKQCDKNLKFLATFLKKNKYLSSFVNSTSFGNIENYDSGKTFIYFSI